eukprot:5336724-Prymnesium_polylepis.1
MPRALRGRAAGELVRQVARLLHSSERDRRDHALFWQPARAGRQAIHVCGRALHVCGRDVGERDLFPQGEDRRAAAAS